MFRHIKRRTPWKLTGATRLKPTWWGSIIAEVQESSNVGYTTGPGGDTWTGKEYRWRKMLMKDWPFVESESKDENTYTSNASVLVSGVATSTTQAGGLAPTSPSATNAGTSATNAFQSTAVEEQN